EVWRGEDLRRRSRLLVRGPAGGGLGEHHLGPRVGVALLLVGAEAAVVALPDRLDRGVQAEDGSLTLALGAALAAGVEQSPVERALAAVAGVLPASERGVAMVERGQAGDRLPPHPQLRLHGRLADPVLLE